MFLASHAAGTVQNGKLSTSISLANNPAIPIATEQVALTVMAASGAAGTTSLANIMVELTYGDGSTDTSTTDSNGQAISNHTYATAGSFPVVATFAGKPSNSLYCTYCLIIASRKDSCRHATAAVDKRSPFMRVAGHIHATYGMSQSSGFTSDSPFALHFLESGVVHLAFFCAADIETTR